jgi:hypothetical protein
VSRLSAKLVPFDGVTTGPWRRWPRLDGPDALGQRTSRARADVAAEELTVLVTVKSAPIVGAKTGEAVCVAGIRTDGLEPEWIRLFPFPFRDLPREQQFKKYQVITLSATKGASSDSRPESWTPQLASLELGEQLGTQKGWAKRRAIIDPLEIDSMCELQRRQAIDRTSLGMFRPTDVEMSITEEPGDWTPAQAAKLDQLSLFGPTKSRLERIPWRFKYHYRCSDQKCGGHNQSYIDWEVIASWLNWRYPLEEKKERVLAHYVDMMCGTEKDTRFFVGNMHLHEQSFLVLGVFWPPSN